jgi:hypothetical protein
MTFPFTELSLGAREGGLIAGLLIGIAFGFVLERAGFGRAPKLAAQFYGRDMTVFKVMFTAIVTAMLGLVAASAFGLTNLRDISESIASWTYLWPMLIGGLVLGIGFIVSGYCPGTSVVAAGSGNVDGIVTVGGVITGTFLYSELLQIPLFHAFHVSGEKGALFLYDLVPIRPQVLAVIIALFAIAAFFGADKLERILNKSGAPSRSAGSRARRYSFATVVTLAMITVATLAIPVSAPAESTRPNTITAAEVSRALVDHPWTLRVVDVRDAASFAKDRVPHSENVAAANVADIPDDGRTLVVIGDVQRVPAHARVLAGGFEAWAADPLAKAMTSGAPPPPPPPPAAGVIAKPKKKGGGCS